VNQPPNTFLSLFPDSTISPQKTRLKITWWGDDPDGLVQGFRISFDSTNWTFTTKNDSTFQLQINGQDSTFRFWVAAVDDIGNIDPTPATNLYPVVNSPPSVAFNPGTEIPDTSFPVATFAWTGTDPDGNSTIKYYYYALNDTTTWRRINANLNTITLRQDSGIVPNSNNRLYLKAEDIAGIYSPVVKMPDTNRTWYVRAKVGNILLINDYFRAAPTDVGQAVQFYNLALDTLTYGVHSNLDIKVNNGGNIPKIKNPMFVETLKLFQCVIWFGNRSNSANDNTNFSLATETLPYYIASGGKLFFSTGFPTFLQQNYNYLEFAPVDSVTNATVGNPPVTTSTIVVNTNYPELQVGPSSPDAVRGIYPRATANVIYKLPFNVTYDTSKVNICIKDNLTSPKVFVMSVPLNRMNEIGTAIHFLRKVLALDFGIN